jgi:nucleoside-diphosphate-sugar epimerase
VGTVLDVTDGAVVSTPVADSGWFAELSSRPARSVLITGGSGHLGTRLAQVLAAGGHRVTVLDVTAPVLDGIRFVPCDLRRETIPRHAVEGADSFVHLAGIHGPHLLSGVRRSEFWPVNVHGTQAALELAADAGVPRFLLASSTSVYGSGSPPGELAKVLDEERPVEPDDVYDYTKLAAETLVREAYRSGPVGVALRFGRFDTGSNDDYHLRKLSTGVDMWDACQAVVRVLFAPTLSRSLYCVASDLPLPAEDRAELGHDAPGVLDRWYPEVTAAFAERGIAVPARVGKSVDSAALRRDTGYVAERTLRWAALHRAGEPRRPARPRTSWPADMSPLAT